MLKYYCTIYFSLLFLCYGTTALASQPRITNFNQAKIAAIAIHKEATSFYCGCKIQWQGRKGLVDHASCGYQIRRNPERANRIEWEHVMPAAHFGYRLKCWQSGGRTHCEDNKRYIKMETDLHNLQPAIGEINENRSNFQFSQWHGSATQYGQCEMKIDFKNRLAEPPEHTRGAIARTYFYMRDQYKIKLSNSQTQLMKVWNVLYPVTEWECERDKRIAAVQGNHNPYVLNACLSIN